MQINIIETDHEQIENYINGHASNGHEIFGPIHYEDGYIFRVYAPNADQMFIKGDFTNWENHQLSDI